MQVKDIDSKSMLIHIQRGKGGRDRYVPLSPKLLETLREYWRWMKPKTWLFPGTVHNWRADTTHHSQDGLGSPVSKPLAAPASSKRVTPHLLRHSCARPICWRREPICAPFSSCSAMAVWKHTAVYLHLSQRHLQAFPNPLESLQLLLSEKAVHRSRRKHKQ